MAYPSCRARRRGGEEGRERQKRESCFSACDRLTVLHPGKQGPHTGEVTAWRDALLYDIPVPPRTLNLMAVTVGRKDKASRETPWTGTLVITSGS